MRDKYGWYIYNPSKSYGSSPSFATLRDLQTRQGFSSLYGVEESTAKAIQQEGTTRNYKGVVWAERLWLDIDNKERSPEGYSKVDRVLSRLKGMGYDFVAYDSGSGGAHFGILREALPSHLLPEKDKAWVSEHFPEADGSIYTALHLFRLPGTVHEVTGAPKSLVIQQSGKSLILPKLDRRYYGPIVHIPSDNRDRSVFDCFQVMVNTVPAKLGDRHATLVKLAYSLKQEARVSREAATWWLGEANKLFEDRKSEEEITKIVGDVYR